MDCLSKKVDQAVTIKVTGRMDAVTAPDFEQECRNWIAQGNKDLLVDLSGLEYISSAGLRVILGVGKKLKSGNGSLVFGGMSGMVKEVFEISGFSSIFPVHDSLESALAAK
ncbi:MAG TPA: anti-sigma factor antagonist [Desulfobacteraceae bacterium]|nr:anti-sigma factor antagonist [Desulfobacteraceae bacterium]